MVAHQERDGNVCSCDQRQHSCCRNAFLPHCIRAEETTDSKYGEDGPGTPIRKEQVRQEGDGINQQIHQANAEGQTRNAVDVVRGIYDGLEVEERAEEEA